MVLDGRKLGRKIVQNSKFIVCRICHKEIEKSDLINGNFIYSKNLSENYYHKKCIGGQQ